MEKNERSPEDIFWTKPRTHRQVVYILYETRTTGRPRIQELCESEEVDVLGSPSLTVRKVSVDVNQH